MFLMEAVTMCMERHLKECNACLDTVFCKKHVHLHLHPTSPSLFCIRVIVLTLLLMVSKSFQSLQYWISRLYLLFFPACLSQFKLLPRCLDSSGDVTESHKREEVTPLQGQFLQFTLAQSKCYRKHVLTSGLEQGRDDVQ